VITYDRRGFGASSRPSIEYDFDTLGRRPSCLLSRLTLRGVPLAGFAMGPVKWPATWPLTAQDRSRRPCWSRRCCRSCSRPMTILTASTGASSAGSPPASPRPAGRDRMLPYEATGSRLPALLTNARSVIIAGGPHAII